VSLAAEVLVMSVCTPCFYDADHPLLGTEFGKMCSSDEGEYDIKSESNRYVELAKHAEGETLQAIVQGHI
jgi:hypothetical protein